MYKKRKGIHSILVNPVFRWHSVTVAQWMKLALFHLFLVAVLGLLMRLKMIFPLPALNQKYLLHAHSHFAFMGWVTQALMVLTAAYILNDRPPKRLARRYQFVLYLNLMAAYGMMVSFLIQGYDRFSISFSTLSVLASYIFAAMAWNDLKRKTLKASGSQWMKAGLFFLLLSSVGTFWLAWIMSSGLSQPRPQLAATYFYLHFQYNGWFFFACMALFINWIRSRNPEIRIPRLLFPIFLVSCTLGYLLSILWWEMPPWLYLMLVLAVIAQTLAWAVWGQTCWKNRRSFQEWGSSLVNFLLLCVFIAATIKITLQGLSVIPSLSTLSYSFRPIVIGYLHLVLLGVISLFLLAFGVLKGYYPSSLPFRRWSRVFVLGVIANEIILMLQGITGLIRKPIPHLPEGLALAATVMVISLAGLVFEMIKGRDSGMIPSQ